MDNLKKRLNILSDLLEATIIVAKMVPSDDRNQEAWTQCAKIHAELSKTLDEIKSIKSKKP